MDRFERMVEIDAPVERVFDLFSDFESFPAWMGAVREVRRTGPRRHYWVCETALGEDAEWEALTTHYEPDRRLAWRSSRGDVDADGEAVFSETPEGTTLVRVVVGYDTPGGRTGPAVTRFFGWHPGRQLEEDLERFRRAAERRGRRRPRAQRDERGQDARRFEDERAEARARRRDDERARGGRSDGGRFDERDYRGPDDGPSFVRRPRHALTPREREREDERERAERAWGESSRVLRRGVDRLLEEPPSRRFRRGRDDD